jgi:hypothetical protein
MAYINLEHRKLHLCHLARLIRLSLASGDIYNAGISVTAWNTEDESRSFTATPIGCHPQPE